MTERLYGKQLIIINVNNIKFLKNAPEYLNKMLLDFTACGQINM